MSRLRRLPWLALVWPLSLAAQTPDLAGILQRLDRLECENRDLASEVRALRAEVAAARGTSGESARTAPPDGPTADAAPAAPVEERLDIQERRIEELSQTKVEASQRFPIKLSGVALFNAFANGREGGRADYPGLAVAPGTRNAGATLRQTIIGLEFRGPGTLWGGQVHGSVYMDFFGGGSSATAPLAQSLRFRTGSVEIEWKNRSIAMGVEKPIFNPREPSSLARVGVSPLTGSGNLWLWLPQVSAGQNLAFGPSSGLRARVGVVETRETGPYDAINFTGAVEPSRPGWEGRFEFYHNLDDERRLEIAPGFHVSRTHAGGLSVPSNLFSLDWFFNPWRPVEFTGAFFSGQNLAHLGTGGINQGYEIYGQKFIAIRGEGGWGQFTVHAARRVDFHFFSGTQHFENAQLASGDIGRNLLYGGNLFFRIAPNVILGPEVTQVRTSYIRQGVRLNNHYDLALAYFF